MNKLINKKVTLKRTRPNPLFEEWLANMHKEARAKKSKLEPMLNLAMDSLSKYPVPLLSGSECMILKGFGKELCKYLDVCLERYNQKLALSQSCSTDVNVRARSESPTSSSSSSAVQFNKYIPCSSSTTPTSDINQNYEEPKVKSQNGLSKNNSITHLQTSTALPYKKSASNSEINVDDISSNINPHSPLQSHSLVNNGKKKLMSKKYQPAYRTGGYAIMVTLLEQETEHPDKPFLTKEELIEKAQKHSEESFVRPKPETYYTAWSNMTNLISKGLVDKIKKKKVEYFLTGEGKKLAREILKEAEHQSTINDIIFNDIPTKSSVVIEQNVHIIDNEVPSTSQNINNVLDMAPGTFDIILLIDKNETGGVKKKNDPTVAQFNKYPDLKHEYRNLKVGDFTWIAQNKENKDQELVLPFIIERKRMDDLGASIKDGRFHEQKFRLRKCGLSNVIYMVENYGKNKHVGLPLQHLMQALANTRVQDGFKVHITDSLTNSARFLAMLTKRLTVRYKDKHLQGHSDEPIGDNLMTFDYFNKSSAKTKALTVTETFIKLLLQLKGMSVEKALAITTKYPTPRSLIKAYSKCSVKEGESLLAHLKYGDLNRNVGPVTSKSIYQLFSSSGGPV